MSRHDISPTRPVPSAFSTASRAAKRAARCRSRWRRAAHHAISAGREQALDEARDRAGPPPARTGRRPPGRCRCRESRALKWASLARASRAPGPGSPSGPATSIHWLRECACEAGVPGTGRGPFSSVRMMGRRAMRAAKPSLADRSRSFLDAYTHGLKREDLQRLFTRDTREAYRFFARNFDEERLSRPVAAPPVDRPRAAVLLGVHAAAVARPPRHLRRRRCCCACSASSSSSAGSAPRRSRSCSVPCRSTSSLPLPRWAPGATSLFVGFLLVNLLVLLEVADRLSLKNDLEIARDIQYAMLPQAKYDSPSFEAFGLTRPANTVGGDFYDVLPLPGRPRRRHARRRVGQGQPRGAADGAAARDVPHARGRRASRRPRSPRGSTSRCAATRPPRASSRCSSPPATRRPAGWST